MPTPLADLDDIITATKCRVDLDPAMLRQGLNQIEVECPEPRYASVQIAFRDDNLAPLFVPLEPVGERRYGKSLSLIGHVREARLELAPHSTADDPISVRIGPVSQWQLLTMALRAARRHLKSPATLMAKIRQVIGGRASFVFTQGESQPRDAARCYRNWRKAFESDLEESRLQNALHKGYGGRRVRVLAVVTDWPFGPEPFEAQLRSLTAANVSDISVLSFVPHNLRPPTPHLAGLKAWVDHDLGSATTIPLESIAKASREVAADLILFLEQPGLFHRFAIPAFALGLADHPAAIALYADHDDLDGNGERHRPSFKPMWSPDYLAAYNYIGHAVAFRGKSSIICDGNGTVARTAAAYSLLAAAARQSKAHAVVHIPRVLFHAERVEPSIDGANRDTCETSITEQATGMHVSLLTDPAASPRLHRIHYPISPATPISVIIPSKDNPEMLAKACQSVTTSTTDWASIVIVDNGSTSDRQSALLADLSNDPRIRVISSASAFNFSHLINLGRAACNAEILVLLNDDVEAIETSWLAELVSQAARSEIGAVGALLLYPDRTVQHAGVVLGINSGAGHAFRFAASDTDGDGYRLRVTHEVSAVTGACLAVRASVFDQVKGFSEDLPVTLNDIDFCLKLRQQGYRNLFTPHARLIHRESTSRGLDTTPERLRRLATETAIFHRKWGASAIDDPYYSPHLTRSHEDFRWRSI